MYIFIKYLFLCIINVIFFKLKLNYINKKSYNASLKLYVALVHSQLKYVPLQFGHPTL